jgi:hypothetical protein
LGVFQIALIDVQANQKSRWFHPLRDGQRMPPAAYGAVDDGSTRAWGNPTEHFIEQNAFVAGCG